MFYLISKLRHIYWCARSRFPILLISTTVLYREVYLRDSISLLEHSRHI